jgi:hypothetical protein
MSCLALDAPCYRGDNSAVGDIGFSFLHRVFGDIKLQSVLAELRLRGSQRCSRAVNLLLS